MEQLTLDMYQQVKREIKEKLNETTNHFVAIGFKLKRIRDEVMYEQDGYRDIFEFAQSEFGLSKSTASRFMAINDKYAIGGNDEQIDPRWASYGVSKLQEMLTLPEDAEILINEHTTVSQIREVKRAAESKVPEGTSIELAAVDYWRTRPDVLKLIKTGTICIKEMVEMINPSGAGTWKKGTLFVTFHDTKITYRVFGSTESGTMEYGDWYNLALQMDTATYQEIVREAEAKERDEAERIRREQLAAVEKKKEEELLRKQAEEAKRREEEAKKKKEKEKKAVATSQQKPAKVTGEIVSKKEFEEVSKELPQEDKRVQIEDYITVIRHKNAAVFELVSDKKYSEAILYAEAVVEAIRKLRAMDCE